MNKRDIAMTENDNVISIEKPDNPLEQLLKNGAQQLLAQAIEAELAVLLAQYQDETVEGLQRIVKNGHQPERTIQTGLWSLGNCSDCDGYHTVVRTEDDSYICVCCFLSVDSLQWCGWCNEPNTGDMEYSSWTGCNHCDGRAGWDKDD